MDKSKQPGISFDGIILVKEDFWRNFDVPSDTNVDLKFEANNSINNNHATVEIVTSLRLVHGEDDVLTLESKFIGFFSTIDDNENMTIEDYINNNAAALMFPYIREHISSITGRSGIKPVMLPPVNLMAILNK